MPAGHTAVTHTFLYRISLAYATENDFKYAFDALYNANPGNGIHTEKDDIFKM